MLKFYLQGYTCLFTCKPVAHQAIEYNDKKLFYSRTCI